MDPRNVLYADRESHDLQWLWVSELSCVGRGSFRDIQTCATRVVLGSGQKPQSNQYVDLHKEILIC